MHVVKLPTSSLADIPSKLRGLAEEIEQGLPVKKLAWVAEDDAGQVSVGLLGSCAEPASATYMLLGMAQQRILEG